MHLGGKREVARAWTANSLQFEISGAAKDVKEKEEEEEEEGELTTSSQLNRWT